ncbi:MAG: FtsQ-type POTRA domain-containing protein [Acidobacteria bacterium]|nr:FtsQ-type POTRA domain-containing protein [Acidobacteriota bacterium]
MREQVITPRAGRQTARTPSKGRAAASSGQGAQPQQHPTRARRTRPQQQMLTRAKGGGWKAALVYLPSAIKLLLAITLGMLAFVGYRTAASASFFQVRTVDVQGAARASRDEIKAAVLRSSSKGVWQADLERISERLRALPWVRTAVVSRVLPSGLRVRVTERTPAVIARTGDGHLVWVDEEGVVLGAASPGEQDFFIRGLDDGRSPESRQQNRERVAAALELSREWAQKGVAGRVSEVNLDDLRDVRVQLAGDDAHVEVRLGREEFAKRFRQALEVLDAQRNTPRGPFVTYVDVSQGKRAVVGTGATAHTPLESSAGVEADGAPQAGAEGAGAEAAEGAAAAAGQGQPPVVKAAAKKEISPAKRVRKPEKKASRTSSEQGKRNTAARPVGEAVRPRRVG